jgi:outer membrane immunogenic protein
MSQNPHDWSHGGRASRQDPAKHAIKMPCMRRLAGAVALSAASILSSVSALAADLPAEMQPVAPVAYVPAFSWTGFYLGGALGWIGTNRDYTTGALVLGAPFIVSSASGKNGLTYGILSGYNYQVGQLVLGVEGDFTGGTVGKIQYTAITGDFLTAHSKWGGSIRGRLGYAADRALFYLTGGAAFASNETSIPLTSISIGGDGTRWGWTVGGGLDYAFTNNWFTGIEYRYSQYETKNFVYPIPILNLGLVGFKQETSINQVTARIGYKF